MPRKSRAPSKNTGGRPTSYRPEFATQAYHLALLGATNPDVARALGVATSTVDLWIKEKAEFSGALKRGREAADANVAKSLYRRALGYSHKAVKIITVAQGGNMGSEVEEIPYIERYPPDTTACIFWLKNRRPQEWRDKQELDVKIDSTLAEKLKRARGRRRPA
jgi:hypothetical protein